MKTGVITIQKYVADDGFVFDWKEPRFIEDEKGNQIQEHLYAKELYIGAYDTIDNYIEIVKPE